MNLEDTLGHVVIDGRAQKWANNDVFLVVVDDQVRPPGKKIKFWFPPQKLLPLMTTPEMTIWASTFQGRELV